MAQQNQRLITMIPVGKLCHFIDETIRKDTPEEHVRKNIFSRDVIRGGIWKSKLEPVDQIMDYIKNYNQLWAKPFKLTYTGKPMTARYGSTSWTQHKDSRRTHGNSNRSQKPQPVVTAVNSLWASLSVGLAKMLMDFSNLSAATPAVLTNFILLFSFALIGFLIFKIYAGRNWARITFLVMFIIGVLPTLPIALSEFSRSAVVGALSVAQISLQIHALFLLFTKPGSSWFRKVVPG